MPKVFKNPGDQASNLWEVPKYNKNAIVSFLKQYGDGFTDEAYKEWATKKGKALQGKPLNPEFLKSSFAKQHYGDATETYADQYLNDDEWLEEAWPSYAEDALDFYTADEADFDDIDDDYERSFGPVDTREKYDAYLKWKKNN